MAVAAVSLNSSINHLRPLDLSRDLTAVADLVEVCFADTLDADGKQYLKDMRDTARHSMWWDWMLPLAEKTPMPGGGYVWEENGRVVGNMSLIPFVTHGRKCYLIANVAVHPEYRGQGIGRALTAAGLDYSLKRNARSVWLQVRADNPPAIHIYVSLGFQERTRRTTWINDSPILDSKSFPLPAAGYTVRSRNSSDWPAQLEWLKRIYPSDFSWHLPVDWKSITPNFWGFIYCLFMVNFPRHWVIQHGGVLQGVLSWQQSNSYADTLWLAYPEVYDEGALQTLFWTARRQLANQWRFRSLRPIVLNLPAGVAERALPAVGFYNQQTLMWMEVKFD